MAYQSTFNTNQSTLEYGKFVELQNDARFPPISVVHYEYPDMGTPGVSSLSIYPKTALITYLANPEDIKVSLSAENINVNVADIETLLIRSNTLVDTISAEVRTMDARVFNINSHVSTIDTRTSAITALLTSTNTLVNSVSALLGNQLGINGVVFCQPSNGTVTQNFNAIQVLSACKFSAIGIANSTTTGLTNYELPQNFTLTAPITSLTLSYGAVIAFK
jgi:hypothetical protein